MTSKTATILFVDDEHHVTDALLRVMRLLPFELLSATSAAGALEILKTVHVDVVVSDEQMPGMSGSVFLAQVRRLYPHTIRIILSGQASLEAAVRAINEGEVYRFFLKPCNPTDLTFTIKQALAHKKLEQQSRRLLREFQKQAALIEKARHSSALTHLDTDDQGAIVIDESDGEGDLDSLVEKMELAMTGTGA
jgi:two-component system probable response regulator PhcQ